MKITGFIFAAGLGTRLYPLTASRPKALVRHNGKTLLDSALDKIFEAGIDHVIVNVHHFPDQIIDALRERPERECICVSDERAYLRDTAGGIKFAEHLWDESELLLFYNVDILSNIDLNKLIQSHIQTHSDATLAVRHRQTQRYFLFQHDSGELCGWRNVKTGEEILTKEHLNADELAFSGIHVMNTALARCIPSVEKASVTNFYLAQSTNRRISAYIHDEDSWCDVGKYDQFRNSLS
jgi:NDP-sugar pyrophosphorylase family protein